MFFFDTHDLPIRPVIVPNLAEKSALDYFADNAHLFQGEKYLNPFSYNKTMAKQIVPLVLDRLHKMGLNPQECVVFLLEAGTTGPGEAFWEYVTGKLYAGEGFLVENQLQYLDIDGIPDFGAYYLPNLQHLLQERHLIENGDFICDLAAVRVFGKLGAGTPLSHSTRENTFVLGEVKTKFPGQKKYIEQVYKYTRSGCFDRIVQITPGIRPLNRAYDSISINPPSIASIQESEESPLPQLEWQAKKKIEFTKDITLNVKKYLLKNLTLSELIELYKQHKNKPKCTTHDLLDSVIRLDERTIVEYLTSIF